MRYVNTTTLPEFVRWLEVKRPLGLSLTDSQLAVGDDTGASWGSLAANNESTLQVITAVAESGRKAWSDWASQVAVRLSRIHGLDIDSFTWLLDATTARNVVHPDDLSKDPRRKRAGAAREAVATARLMAALTSEAVPLLRSAVLVSCHQEQLWRRRQLLGWRVDVQLLSDELRTAEEGRRRMVQRLGIDLTSTRTQADKDVIHAWLATVGIFVKDFDGEPSLDRDDYDTTDVPGTAEAQARWVTFRQVRSIASRISKLREIRSALVGDRIFSTVSVRNAMTGRAAVIKPALQNLNRDLRPLLIADPGFTLVALDYDQVEPRTAAGLSGDTALLTALLASDVYAALARSIWGAAADDANGNVVPSRRAQAKSLLLGILYGEGKKMLARKLDITIEEAAKLVAGVWGAYPDLAAYNKKIQKEMSAGQAELTTTGRIVPPPKRGEHAVLNNRTQAEAADIFYSGIARTIAIMGTEAAWLGVHDELVVSVPTNRVEWARNALECGMNTMFMGVPITGVADALGPAWRKH